MNKIKQSNAKAHKAVDVTNMFDSKPVKRIEKPHQSPKKKQSEDSAKHLLDDDFDDELEKSLLESTSSLKKTPQKSEQQSAGKKLKTPLKLTANEDVVEATPKSTPKNKLKRKADAGNKIGDERSGKNKLI